MGVGNVSACDGVISKVRYEVTWILACIFFSLFLAVMYSKTLSYTSTSLRPPSRILGLVPDGISVSRFERWLSSTSASPG